MDNTYILRTDTPWTCREKRKLRTGKRQNGAHGMPFFFLNGVMDNMVCGISVLCSNAFDGCEHEHEHEHTGTL